ncbi:MAG TPA: hypothetical protein ENO08_08260 [Candidatus Eisenbacteria bacterium]|uniref:Uncharacterized protein n=1 Tax=Eiseniibacteriota bacterium TaxID=2212470 RepID=A0A7V2AWB4_UNCEI|nr:hypothetical protein [Candidatus Eisenbacteria bacterium]
MESLGVGTECPLQDPAILGRAVRMGILDAPELVGSNVAPGIVVTAPVGGGYDAVDSGTGGTMSEEERLRRIRGS